MTIERTLGQAADARPAVLPRARLAHAFHPWDDKGDAWRQLPRTWDHVFDRAEGGEALMLRFLGHSLKVQGYDQG